MTGIAIEKPVNEITLPKSTIEIDEVLSFSVPVNSVITIENELFFTNGIVEDGLVEFSAERKGVYNFTISCYPYREAKFQIEVVL